MKTNIKVFKAFRNLDPIRDESTDIYIDQDYVSWVLQKEYKKNPSADYFAVIQPEFGEKICYKLNSTQDGVEIMETFEQVLDKLYNLIMIRKQIQQCLPTMFESISETIDQHQMKLEHELQKRLGLEIGDYDSLYSNLKAHGIDLT